MMGICMDCQKLVFVRQVKNRFGPRADYVPIHHDKPNGDKCFGHQKIIR